MQLDALGVGHRLQRTAHVARAVHRDAHGRLVGEVDLEGLVADLGLELGGRARGDDAGIDVEDVSVRRPTLDDVFLVLTGRGAEQDAPAAPEAEPQEVRG